MSAAQRVAHAAETIRARWERRVSTDPQTEAAQALEDTGQLLDPEVAAELVALRVEVAALREERHRMNEWADDAAKALRADRDRIAELEAVPTFVYRAEHPDSGIVLGTYSSREAAVAHCEALARREGLTGLVSWVPDDGDALSPEELTFFDVEYCDGDDVPVQTCTGYVVTPLEVASEYDEEADE